jgi:hypothetical protein
MGILLKKGKKGKGKGKPVFRSGKRYLFQINYAR